jgi:hypothetical protein
VSDGVIDQFPVSAAIPGSSLAEVGQGTVVQVLS